MSLENVWQLHLKNPVIVPGQLHGELDSKRAGAAHVTRIGDRLRMVYWGTGSDGKHRILAAEAPLESPNDWKPLGSLIGCQPEIVHNSTGPGFPFLLPLNERRWLLYFCGWGHTPGKRLPNTTSLAISDDAGKTWRYHDANPILPLDHPYDREATGSLWILNESGRLRMYYTAIARYVPRPEGVMTGHGEVIPEIGIGYAESEDGIRWTKPFDDWVVSPRRFGVEPYEYICSKPSVLVEDCGATKRYTIWVNTFGTAYRVHRLTSHDGIHWEWGARVGPDGELGTGAPGGFDDVQRSYPVMVRHGEICHCWYTGNGFGATGMGYAHAKCASTQ